MTLIVLASVIGFIVALVGGFAGNFVYDAAKLYRRTRRRARKLATELDSNTAELKS